MYRNTLSALHSCTFYTCIILLSVSLLYCERNKIHVLFIEKMYHFNLILINFLCALNVVFEYLYYSVDTNIINIVRVWKYHDRHNILYFSSVLTLLFNYDDTIINS